MSLIPKQKFEKVYNNIPTPDPKQMPYANGICATCIGKQMLGINFECNRSSCSAILLMQHLAKENYDCIVLPQKPGEGLVVILVMPHNYEWGYALIHDSGTNYIIDGPWEFFEPDFHDVQTIPISHFCAKMGW